MRSLLILLLPAALGCTRFPGTGETIALDGVWHFRTDSLDAGITEQWYQQRLEWEILLPGSMTGNGYGNEVDLHTEWTGDIWDSSYFYDPMYERYRQPGNIKIPFWLKPVRYYAGPAWYQKEVRVPRRWLSRVVTLKLERCHWESRLFVNGHPAGSENSLSTPHTYVITPYLKKGKNRITIRIDNRMIIPVGRNSHSVSDHTQTNWNGIIGEISLRADAPVHIEHIEVFPDLQSASARVQCTLSNLSGRPFHGTLTLEAECFNSEVEHIVPQLRHPVTIPVGQQSTEIEYPMGNGTQYWSEFSPALYRLEAELTDPEGKKTDRQDVAFGMREFGVNGTRFQVNGTPVFLRGTLECCIFPLTGYPPTDEASWLQVIHRFREYGLNHIRFHSWCPPEAAFSAADKLGFYLQVECASWANQGSTIGDGGPLDDYIYREGDRILEAYGNHPSFCMMAYGNEPAGRNQEEYLGALVEYWKLKDHRRVYTSASGWPQITENEFHVTPAPRIQQWEAGLSSVINALPPQTLFDFREEVAPFEVPCVGHEIGQWCVFPDFREIRKYTGVLKPTNFEIFRDLLEEKHMGRQSEDFLMASGKLQALCYKADIEAALRTPGFAGFQLLQLHDFPGQGTALVGVLDPFFDPKGYITADEFRRFCSRTVPLARMEKRVYHSGETFRAGIELAHFGDGPLTGQRVDCRISDDYKTILHEQSVVLESVPVGNGFVVDSVQFPLDGVTSPGKLTLEVSLEGTPCSNSWEFWVYPESVTVEPGEVVITRRLDRRTMAHLQSGGSVLLLTCGQVSDSFGARVEIGFSSIFWNTAWTGGQAPHTLGILCDPDHPLFRDFPTEYHSNWQWWDPVTGSQAMILDHLPPGLRPLIQPIHTWFESRKLGLLFEARAGGGRLMVCSINLQDDLDRRLVSRQLLKSILDYMNSAGFDPETEVEPELIRMITGPGLQGSQPAGTTPGSG